MSAMFSDHVGQIASFAPLAYLDGGSGSLIFQMLIAGSVTAAYAIKTQWTNLVAAVSRLRSRGSRPADQ